MKSNQLPRGLRNHNPLNIRVSSTKWQGMDPAQSDNSFVRFISNAYGYRAAFVTLRTYQQKYGLRTIAKMIGRWAPPNENNTASYIKRVADGTGLDKDAQLPYTDKEHMVRMVMAMTVVENGINAIKSEVEDGYKLAFGF